MPNELVLVSDDDQEVLYLIKERLVKAGYRVLTAADGSMAKQIVRDEHPDLIVLAVDIPSIGGFELCKQVKNDNSLKHIPVILLNDKGAIEDKVAAFELGVHDYLVKPYDVEELLARAGAAIRLKTAHDRLRQKNSKLEALAKHVRAALQHYEQPHPLNAVVEEPVEVESGNGDGKAATRLTRRELEILQLLARGLNNDVISKQLYISPTTTRNHIQNILGKLGVHSKLEAVAYAVRAGYIDFVG